MCVCVCVFLFVRPRPPRRRDSPSTSSRLRARAPPPDCRIGLREAYRRPPCSGLAPLFVRGRSRGPGSSVAAWACPGRLRAGGSSTSRIRSLLSESTSSELFEFRTGPDGARCRRPVATWPVSRGGSEPPPMDRCGVYRCAVDSQIWFVARCLNFEQEVLCQTMEPLASLPSLQLQTGGLGRALSKTKASGVRYVTSIISSCMRR